MNEYKGIFSDVPTVTHLTEHKVELTEKEPVKHKPYSIPHKMREVTNKETDDMLAMGVIERSEVSQYVICIAHYCKITSNALGVLAK